MSAALVWVLSGCSGGAEKDGQSDAAAAVVIEGRLRVEVPAGLAVFVDGVALDGNTKTVEAGAHAVVVQTPCGEATATVEVAGGGQTRVDLDALAGVAWGELRIDARHVDDEAIDPRVMLGDWAVPGGAAKPTRVPACALRLKVIAPADAEVGEYWEDLELPAGTGTERTITLTPGPDVVRLPGGKFRMGPPGPEHFVENYHARVADGYVDEQPGWPWIPTNDVVLEPFELDRTQVTAAQYARCREDGGCPLTGRSAHAKMPIQRGDVATQRCTTTAMRREVVPGREDHPANCIALWEAQEYCAWVGKRLPTEAEWEYAARSGNDQWGCPWGGTLEEIRDPAACDRSELGLGPGHDFHSAPACSNKWTISKQGICGLAGPFTEYVRLMKLPRQEVFVEPITHEPVDWGVRGSSATYIGHELAFEVSDPAPKLQHRIGLGFRCARSDAPSKGAP